MTTILVTRHYSGFANIADRFSLGNHEHEGNASLASYELPAGYVLQDGVIYDTADIQCEIIDVDGAPVVMSLAGRCPSVALQAATCEKQ